MTVKIIPARWSHIRQIKVQDEHKQAHAEICETFEQLSKEQIDDTLRWAWTALQVVPLSKRHCRIDILAVCGITRSWAWALLAPELSRGQMLPIHRRVSKALSDHVSDIGPVLVKIDGFFTPGIRWARLLGFQPIEHSDTWVYYHELQAPL